MPTSAMPKAGNTAPGCSPWRAAGLDEGVDLVGVDRLGAVEGDAQAGQVELLGPLQAPGGEDVREVGAGGGRAAVAGDPLHPPGGAGGEVLRGAEDEAGTGRHRQGQDPDQAHVVVQRQPGHEHVVVDVEPAGLGDGVEVGAQHRVGQHHALGVGRRPAGELQDGQPRRDRPAGASRRRRRRGPRRSRSTIGGSPGSGDDERRPAAGRSARSRSRRRGSAGGSGPRTPRSRRAASAAAAPRWWRRPARCPGWR